ncbi:MAG: glutamate-5-semialdehyde dehydrogenase [Candidatus Omnitrophica bacterium]|nr:glutamate-5-semialdehyde dehydrogenase [Candidatus Omnitrophota bacterium]
MKKILLRLAKNAKESSRALANLSTEKKNEALKKMAVELLAQRDAILVANAKDMQSAKRAKLSDALMGRLYLDEKRLEAMSRSLREIAALKDPVGETLREWDRPNGLKIRKVRVPIGVILIIYESRPNVTSDCAGLCLKSGNSVILRGGSESARSNRAIIEVFSRALESAGISKGTVVNVPTTDRKAVDLLLKMDSEINLVIPRGGEGLIREVSEKSRIPVIKHYKGVCHVYVDEEADLAIAEKVVYNAKVQKPGVCNAVEALLVHRSVAAAFLPKAAQCLIDAGVELRCSAQALKILRQDSRFRENPKVKKAVSGDWGKEFLDLILAVRVVDDLESAVEHIGRFGSQHSDAIITRSQKAAETFTRRVDSSVVFVNTSTRFNDGGEFGMGAEMGISTDKIHARGPMGLEELTSYKYIVVGEGQIRE